MKERYECDDCTHVWNDEPENFEIMGYKCPLCGGGNIYEHGPIEEFDRKESGEGEG